MNGMTGSRYTELEELLDDLLKLDRLKVKEMDPTKVQNDSSRARHEMDKGGGGGHPV